MSFSSISKEATGCDTCKLSWIIFIVALFYKNKIFISIEFIFVLVLVFFLTKKRVNSGETSTQEGRRVGCN